VTISIPMRVYYEDTDLAGIVYYANYLKFIERARSDWVRHLGVDQITLRATKGIVFAVRRVEADYLRPARFGDDLTVSVTLSALGAASMELVQHVMRGDQTLFTAKVILVCLGPADKAVRIPAEIRAVLR
jgi:acyl-CoA thioester hydrolase